MPIYEYVCGNCGHEFELFVRSAVAATNGTCPNCNSNRIDKRFSTFSCCTQISGNGMPSNSAPSCSGPV